MEQKETPHTTTAEGTETNFLMQAFKSFDFWFLREQQGG